jgi:transcriptional regulator with AAA-type ATPase domain
VVDQLRRQAGLTSARPTLHMSLTGNPGTGKTTVALRMAVKALKESNRKRTKPALIAPSSPAPPRRYSIATSRKSRRR